MKLLLVYPPFCTPASPPYALVKLASFLKNNSSLEVEILDLNLHFHELKFSKYQKYFQNFNLADYVKVTKEYLRLSAQTYAENNKRVVQGKDPELIKELLQEIESKQADQIAVSVVYSSQAFYTLALLKKLEKTIVGGPAVNEKIAKAATYHLKNEVEILEKLTGKVEHKNYNFPLEFAVPLNEYFTKQPVLPLKTTSTCYYQQCAFCTHHQQQKYVEFPLEQIEATIKKAKQKQWFLIDDMISKVRLLELAKLFKPLNVEWMCQLRPTKELDQKTLQTLFDSGLRVVIWGVESGCERILKLMQKGTNTKDVAEVLKNSKTAGIRNVTYIMFGFPTETEEELLETIEFLETNQENIDLVSTSSFGLQKGTPIFNNPELFGIRKITEEQRTVLEPKLSYEVKQGLTPAEVSKLKKKYQNRILAINKYPKEMNFFREHLLNS